MKLIVITGQTATGKTKFALNLAQKNNGELINCDSRQIYKGLDIITGKDIEKGSTFTKVSIIGNFNIGYYLIKRSVLTKDGPSQNSQKHKRKRKKQHFEGCLSIPKIWSPVKRSKKILLEYQTTEGEKKSEWFSAFDAIIIQHEVDHLNGILFTQRALEQKSQLYEEKKGKLVKLEY